MKSYHYCGVAFSSGDRVKVKGLDDRELRGRIGTIISIESGGCNIRFGNVAEGHSLAFIHPAKLQKVVS